MYAGKGDSLEDTLNDAHGQKHFQAVLSSQRREQCQYGSCADAQAKYLFNIIYNISVYILYIYLLKTHYIASDFGANVAAQELCHDVAIEKGAQYQTLLFGVPGKVLLVGYIAIGICYRAILSHGHNGHREIHAQRVDIEETKEGQENHNVTLFAPESPC